MALELRAALRRALTAIAPSCSRVVPNSWKWRWAIIPIQLTAEGAPKGSDHCMKLPTRNDDAPPDAAPMPGITAERPLLPWAVASQTVRKHTTWRASPQATAMAALMTDPSWPGDSMPPANQLRFRRSASCNSVTPTPEKPGGLSMPPG